MASRETEHKGAGGPGWLWTVRAVGQGPAQPLTDHPAGRLLLLGYSLLISDRRGPDEQSRLHLHTTVSADPLAVQGVRPHQDTQHSSWWSYLSSRRVEEGTQTSGGLQPLLRL